MLKRIRLIQGVGPFSNCQAGPVEFRKTSIVFGYNSYGKSTLCEVLRSLEIGNTDELAGRATIPGPIPQQVTLTFAEDGKSEESLLLKDRKWAPATPAPFRLHVFDSAFVSRNLFTGGRTERNNREALSRFVLGEQGVKGANQIAEMRRRLALAKASWRKLQSQLQDVGDVDAFAQLDVKQAANELQEEARQIVVALDRSKKNLDVVEQIQSRPKLAGLTLPQGDPALVANVNAILQRTLATVHGAAQARIDEHIASHMGRQRSGYQWIKEGLGYASDGLCPFCEQPLAMSPNGLVDAYRQFFDEAFRFQSSEIHAGLSTFEVALRLWGNSDHANELQQDAGSLSQYVELHEQADFRVLKSEFDVLAKAVADAIAVYHRELQRLQGVAELVVSQKRAAIHQAVEPIDGAEYLAKLAAVGKAVMAYNEHCKAVNAVLDEFKGRSSRSALELDVARLQKELQRREILLKRISSDVLCTDYKNAKRLDAEIESSLRKAEQDLTLEQSTYLKRFFDLINTYFKKFGSQHFTISIDEKFDMQGYQPVLSLVVKYQNVTIAPQNLGAVFSESDRRALALSIFWARLSVLSEAERAMTIAVLDDPITSFDDNRISAAVMIMREEAKTLRQAIVFTHYHAFARHWLRVEQVGGGLGFHRMTRNDVTSSVVDADVSDFLHSEQQKLYRKFVDFIDGRSQEAIGIDLRVYLENEIRDRYRHQIAAGHMQQSMLSDVIDHLAQVGAITPKVAETAHLFREDLNGPHHVLESRGREDWVTLARNMLHFIYEEL